MNGVFLCEVVVGVGVGGPGTSWREFQVSRGFPSKY